MPEPTFVSLYSGAGGLDLGFIRAGYRPVWSNDNDLMAVASYRHNLGDHIHGGDIHRVAVPDEGTADVVIGGPPCQGFSVAGNMNPHDPRSEHVFYFLAVVNHIQPDAFVMENVKALAVNPKWRPIIDELMSTAQTLGYETRLLLLNAADYGVAQSRERMFLIGTRGGRPMEIPEPVHDAERRTLGDVLREMPPLGAPGNDMICTAQVTPARNPVMRRSPYAGLLFNGKGRVLDLNAPALTLPASMGGNRTPIIDQYQLEHGGVCWIEEYHAHLMGGGEPLQRVPDRLRRMTVQEAAAVQTFPSEWHFFGTQTAQFRQIGNAVPPDLAYHVALGLLDVLGADVDEDTREAA